MCFRQLSTAALLLFVCAMLAPGTPAAEMNRPAEGGPM